MEIDLFSLLPSPSIPTKVESQKKEKGFFDLILSGLKETNKLENDADRLTQDLISGKLENLHDLMIASEKAEIALNFTMAIRNQIIRSYQEIMGLGR